MRIKGLKESSFSLYDYGLEHLIHFFKYRGGGKITKLIIEKVYKECDGDLKLARGTLM